jgi:lipopolysaccharide biosynthesis regulator YciM
MRRALHLVLSGDLVGAELELAEAARIDSSSADVYMALANVYRARGEIGRAIQIHQNLLLQHDLPEDFHSESLLSLALDFRSGGFLGRAAASFEELLQEDPNHPQALRELEKLRVESGDWAEAIAIRKRIGSKDPNTHRILAHLWTGLGRAALLESDATTARKAFRRALSFDRECAEAYVVLGDQAQRDGKLPRALQYWRKALPLHAALGDELYARFWDAFLARQDLASFETLLRDRLDSHPDDETAVLWLARVQIRQGNVDEGLAALRRSTERAPDHLAARAEIGRTLLAEDRSPDALKAFSELLERLPLERDRRRCSSCGTRDTQLHWRCPQCGAWDTFS